MTDDLDTLLRDAGRDPTVDPDVDVIHSRGRRRAIGRRVAAGMGVLAAAGAVAVAVSALAPEPTPFVDDVAPSEAAPSEAAPSEGASPTEGSEPAPDRFTPEVAMADLGVTAVDVVRSQDGAGGLHVRVVTSDGVIEEFSTLAGSLPPAWSPVVVDHDLRVWGNDVDPNLLRGEADDPLGSVVARAEDGVGWGLLGSANDGRPLVTRAIGADGQLPEDVGEVLVWTADGPEPIPGISGRPTLTEATPVAATAVGEHLAVLSVVGETSLVDLHLAGADPVAIAETGGAERWFTALTIVGDEVWVSERRRGVTDLWIVPMDGSSVRRVPTPLGRDAGDREVVDLAAVEGPDGPVVAMSTRGEDGTARAYAVAVEAARAAAVEGEVPVDAAAPDDVFRLLDAEGVVHLLPPREAAPVAARCATGPYAQELDSQAVDAVWFPCQGTGGDDRLVSFFPVERLSGIDFADEEARLEAYLGALFDGPTDAEQALGLEPVVSSDVATLAGVTVDGATVTVDIAPGGQVGVLGASHAGSVFATAVAAAVLQFTGYDQVTLTLDGSCQAWAALGGGDGCTVLEQGQTPWSAPAGE